MAGSRHVLNLAVSDGNLTASQPLTLAVIGPPRLAIVTPDVTGHTETTPDGRITQADVERVAVAMIEPYEASMDLNADGVIDQDDLAVVEGALGLFWPPTNMLEGQSLRLFIHATTADGTAAAYGTAASLPRNASLDPTTGEFRWTPDGMQGGRSYTISFTATASGLSADPAVLTIFVQDSQ